MVILCIRNCRSSQEDELIGGASNDFQNLYCWRLCVGAWRSAPFRRLTFRSTRLRRRRRFRRPSAGKASTSASAAPTPAASPANIRNLYLLQPGPFLVFPTSNSIGTSGYLVGYQNGYNWVFANGIVARLRKRIQLRRRSSDEFELLFSESAPAAVCNGSAWSVCASATPSAGFSLHHRRLGLWQGESLWPAMGEWIGVPVQPVRMAGRFRHRRRHRIRRPRQLDRQGGVSLHPHEGRIQREHRLPVRLPHRRPATTSTRTSPASA